MDSHYMNCGLNWTLNLPDGKTMTKVLQSIEGVSYSIDVERGFAYISGSINPTKLLKKLEKAGRHADLIRVNSGFPLGGSNHYGTSQLVLRNGYGYFDNYAYNHQPARMEHYSPVYEQRPSMAIDPLYDPHYSSWSI